MAKIGILSTRSARYHPNRRLMEAARSLGHQPVLLHPHGVLPEAARVGPSTPGPGLPEVVLPRIGSTIEDAELAAVLHLELSGVSMVNGFHALAVARDKFLSARILDSAGIPVPQTLLVAAPGQLPAAVDRLGGFPLVMKACRGRQGTAVFLVKEMAFARYILEQPPRPSEGVIIQRYLPEAASGDVRIVIVGERPVAFMRRVPRRGDFRSNVHLKGRGVPWDPSPEWIELALRATKTLGLQVSGVDMVSGEEGPLVLEVNTTPGFRELERVTGVDVGREMILLAARYLRENRDPYASHSTGATRPQACLPKGR
ncbi:MAG: ATP-grasp domain-containing protein [Thermodesulfobacteriota bacterium]